MGPQFQNRQKLPIGWTVEEPRRENRLPNYPQLNGRAEACVKSLRRIMKGNTGPKGFLHTDDIAKALLQYSNTTLRNISKLPAELALGREL